MTKENKSKYSVLGVLSVCPGSGYDVRKFMEKSTGYFWQESYGQIYPILKQLADEGLATSHTEKHEGKPERYIYTLTDRGRQALQDWLAESVEQSVERNELLLKLFFGAHISRQKNIEHVQVFRSFQSQLLAKYEGIERDLRAEAKEHAYLNYPLMTLRYGIHRCRALLEWCDETLVMLETLPENEQ